MKTVLRITLITLFLLPCFAQVAVTPDMVQDYIDMANLYQSSNNYPNALEYITMIEPYDDYNPKIKYQKVYLLKSLNCMCEAKLVMDKLVQLNQSYACTNLAQTFYKDEMGTICCKGN